MVPFVYCIEGITEAIFIVNPKEPMVILVLCLRHRGAESNYIWEMAFT